jgi:hypothetical protein
VRSAAKTKKELAKSDVIQALDSLLGMESVVEIKRGVETKKGLAGWRVLISLLWL